jgi:hypothetical protein
VLSGQPSTDVGCELQVVVEPIILQLVVNVLVLLKAIAVFDEGCREGTGREGEGQRLRSGRGMRNGDRI